MDKSRLVLYTNKSSLTWKANQSISNAWQGAERRAQLAAHAQRRHELVIFFSIGWSDLYSDVARTWNSCPTQIPS